MLQYAKSFADQACLVSKSVSSYYAQLGTIGGVVPYVWILETDSFVNTILYVRYVSFTALTFGFDGRK